VPWAKGRDEGKQFSLSVLKCAMMETGLLLDFVQCQAWSWKIEFRSDLDDVVAMSVSQPKICAICPTCNMPYNIASSTIVFRLTPQMSHDEIPGGNINDQVAKLDAGLLCTLECSAICEFKQTFLRPDGSRYTARFPATYVATTSLPLERMGRFQKGLFSANGHREGQYLAVLLGPVEDPQHIPLLVKSGYGTHIEKINVGNGKDYWVNTMTHGPHNPMPNNLPWPKWLDTTHDYYIQRKWVGGFINHFAGSPRNEPNCRRITVKLPFAVRLPKKDGEGSYSTAFITVFQATRDILKDEEIFCSCHQVIFEKYIECTPSFPTARELITPPYPFSQVSPPAEIPETLLKRKRNMDPRCEWSRLVNPKNIQSTQGLYMFMLHDYDKWATTDPLLEDIEEKPWVEESHGPDIDCNSHRNQIATSFFKSEAQCSSSPSASPLVQPKH